MRKKPRKMLAFRHTTEEIAGLSHGSGELKGGDDVAREKTKDERIRSEKQRLRKHYKELEPSKWALAQGLIERAAFMRVECEDLEADLEANGWTEPFSQSADVEPYDRARPQGQAYQSLNSNYQKIIKQLDAMLPKTTGSSGDGFEDFVYGRDDG